VPADQSEPGSVLPQKHPLVLYYAAYCKQKLGNDAPQNWQAASELSTSLVFPNSEADRMVLEAAVKANTSDGTAQYLLGTLLFSKGMNDEGMAHWTQAKHFAPHLPTLDVDMGDALLKLKVDPQQAQTWFRDGLRDDPDNAEVYSGLDESMSLTGASAAEREAILSQYPSADAADSKMPASLTYQLALTRAEAGQFDKAEALFKGRFFPGQEGEISSGQILFEIKLMQAGSWARGGSCAQAKNFLAGKEPGAILEGRTARDDMKLAAIAQSCGQKKESEEFLRKATAGADFDDKVPVLQAKRSLGLDDAAKEEQQAAELLAADKKILANSSRPGLMSYNIGLLQLILHEKEQARESFRQVLLLPDTHMSHHFAREALAEFATGK
jgi:tetratricopeptide (TPR) repeat protein